MENLKNCQFTLPTIGSSDMSRDDQGALLVNQATAVIVSSYLDYSSKMHSVSNGGSNLYHTQSELISIINDVQNALRSF